MIISDEQVRRAVEYLQTAQCGASAPIGLDKGVNVRSEFLQEVHRSVMELPDARAERVKQAMELIEGADLSAELVADKMVGRIISDSIR